MRLIASILAVTLFVMVLPSCSLPFYWQAASGQMELLRKRVAIERILEDPAAEDSLKDALRDVAAIRDFAITELQLPDNGSYTSYADLGRPYVVWNVVAAEEFSVEPQQWCFPFAGCVSYRGFFKREQAAAFERTLAVEGLDTYSGGSSAYSTLGYFADPVLNTMLAPSSDAIAALLFHELAHQKLYVKGDSELSEAFASTVEEFGTRAWLKRQRDAEGIARYEQRLSERAAFAELVAAAQQRLGAIYALDLTVERKRAAKAAAFEQMLTDYAAAKMSGAMSSAYDAWFAQPLNIAVLASVATYRRWVPALRWRLETRGLEQFYADVTALAAQDIEPRTAALESWAAAASAAGDAPDAG